MPVPEPQPPEPRQRPPERDVHEITATMDLALRIGELLLSSGAGAADVNAAMDNVAHACGLRGYTVDVMFTQLTMTQQAALDEAALIQIRRVSYRTVDYGDLTEVDRLIRDLVAGTVGRAEAATRLKRIVSTGHSLPPWVVTVAQGVSGAGVAVLLGGDWLVATVAAVAAMLVDRVRRLMGRQRLPSFYQQVCGALLATLLAVGVAAAAADLTPSLVISANIVMLLAGVNFLGAIQDALTGFPLTAGARLLEALLATAGVVAGVSGGLQVADLAGVDIGPVNFNTFSVVDVPVMAVGGGVASAAYAFSCYAPRRSLLPIGIVSAIGIGIYGVVYDRGFGVAWASAMAAVWLGLVGYAISSRTRVPALVVVTAGIMPLLPGLSIYRALTLVSVSASAALLAMANSVAIALALSSGAILGEYVAQPIRREARRLEDKFAGPRLVGPRSARGERGERRRRQQQRQQKGQPGST